MLSKVRCYAKKYDMLPSGGTVIAAVSGGADSVCLLHLLHRLSEEMGFTLHGAHFNHQIRGDEADRDQEFVRKMCEELHIPCHIGCEDVPEYAKSHGIGLEDAGRVLRYAFFDKIADRIGANRIATAHNGDDNCETVLMNMTRGAGLRGLCGIPPVRGRIVRPLLTVSRDEIERYLIDNNLPHVEDSTNSHDDYTRNRIRHQVMPVLRGINPDFVSKIGEMTQSLSLDRDFLEAQAAKLLHGGALSVSELRQSPEPVAARAVRMMCPHAPTAGQTEDILNLVRGERPSGAVYLTGGKALREYDILRFDTCKIAEKLTDFVIYDGLVRDIPEIGMTVRCRESVCGKIIYKSLNLFLFKTEGLCGTISVGSRREGDRITLAGRNITKSVKKLMIEEKIPPSRRELVPVLRDDRGVIGILGLGQAAGTVPKVGDRVMEIIFEKYRNSD